MTAEPVLTERADARHNREVVLRSAALVFAEEGVGVSLGRIARHAGVGAGTVYRHFPSKEILLEAVLARHVADLVAAADRWAAQAAPGAALTGYLLELIEKSVGRQHVCEALTADRSWPRATLTAELTRFRDAFGRLLRNAKRAGAVRADLRLDDLTAFVVSAAALRSAHPDQARGTWLVRRFLDGLSGVTKSADFRDNSAPRGHETHDRRCAECGVPLPLRSTGRPSRYCGATCRQRAHRRRLAG